MTDYTVLQGTTPLGGDNILDDRLKAYADRMNARIVDDKGTQVYPAPEGED